MDTNLNLALVSPILQSTNGGTNGVVLPQSLTASSEFSGLLTGHLLKFERQEFAAQALNGIGLQELALGSNLKLITSDAPLPDLASLAAFARSQGLDEAAVQILFSSQFAENRPMVMDTAAKLKLKASVFPEFIPIELNLAPNNPGLGLWPTSLTPPANPSLALPLQPTISSVSNPLAPAQWTTDSSAAPITSRGQYEGLPQALPEQEGGMVTEKINKNANISKVAFEFTPSMQTVEQPQGAGMPRGQHSNQTGIRADTAPSPLGATPAPSTASPVIATNSLISWPSRMSSIATDALPTTNTSPPTAEVAMQDAARVTMALSTQGFGKRLAPQSLNSEQNAGATLLAGNFVIQTTPPTVLAWERLQLHIRDDIAQDLQDQLFGRPNIEPSELSFGTNLVETVATTAIGPADQVKSAPPSQVALLEQRLIHQQQLSDKLAQALAHRMVSQIERGQWKMQLRLQPENLGQIDVELKLHAGGLDALFRADNPLTRELIAQGTAKLKDTLTQAGMAVASVWVNGDQSRQSGGNSTAGQGFQAASSMAPLKPHTEEHVMATVKSEPAASHGLNIWA